MGGSPSVIVPPRGLNITPISMIGRRSGLVHKKNIGDVNARIFGTFLGDNARKRNL